MRARELFEGAWAFPDTPEKVEKLKKLMLKPMSADEAKSALNDILGNHDLMALLDDLKKEYPDEPVNDHVMQWLRHNYHDIFVQLAKQKDWHGMVSDEDKQMNDVGLQSPLGHHKNHPNQ